VYIQCYSFIEVQLRGDSGRINHEEIQQLFSAASAQFDC